MRTLVLAGVSALVGAVLVLVGGAVGYSIGQHDGDNHRNADSSVAADRNAQQGDEYGDGPMMGHDDEYGMNRDGGMMPGQGGMDQRGSDPDGDNWTGPNREGGMMGGGSGPMMQGNGIQDFLNQLQSGQGLSPDQQQFLDQLKGFVGGMRNQMG